MTDKSKITGTEAVRRKLAEMAERFPRATAAALFEEANIIFAASQRIVPVDTGRLRSTGLVPIPEFNGNGRIIQRIGYGTDYALALHSPKTRTYNFHGDGQSYYLEEPFDDALPGMARRLTKRIEQHALKGVGLTPLPAMAVEGDQKLGPSRWRKGKKKKKGKRKGGKK